MRCQRAQAPEDLLGQSSSGQDLKAKISLY